MELETLKIPAGLDVMEEGKPFFFEGSKKAGCLLVHGFTGTTSSMKLMGDYMAEKGLTVLGPRLPGHGTDVKDMGLYTMSDWTSTVEKAYAEISEICEKVFVSGLSMGGLLTLYMGEKHPEIAGLIPISAPVVRLAPGAQNYLLKLIPVLKHVMKTFPGPGNDLKDPDVVEVAYEKLSTNALHELVKLADVVRPDLARITQPIRIYVAHDDHVVPPENASYIFDNVGSKDKEIIWLDNCCHVATLDLDKDRIFSESYNFISRLAGL